MIRTIKKVIRNIFSLGIADTLRLAKSTLLKKYYYKGRYESHSQYNEDLLIDRLLNHKKIGFYVDAGAYDPKKLSNTKIFYDRGWRGINIDPNPGTIEKFEKERPKDVNLNIGLSDVNTKLRAVLFKEMKSYTLSQELISQRLDEGFKIEKDLQVDINTLSNILKKYAHGQKVDLLSIDTEGLDLKVLKGNDWDVNRPKIICVETYTDGGQDRNYKKQLQQFLKEKGYELKHDTGLNGIFLDTKA